MSFSLKNVISIKDFSKKDINYILKEAEGMEPIARSQKTSQVMTGRILGMMFYEPSTRTRLSFETAMKRMSGGVIGFAETGASSVTKGENLADTARMVAEYADALVIRHNLEGAARYVSDIVNVPVINAGDGAGQHPTQTLLDLYTMRRIFGKIDGLKVALIGDLKYGRTVHSLSYALGMFGVKMSFVSPPELRMPPEILHDLKQNKVVAQETNNLQDVLDEVDILYVTRIQKERFPDPEEYSRIKGAYQIDASLIKGKDLIVMHPLPRVDEVSPDLDDTPYGKYFEQAFYGVPVRMALLNSLLSSF
ncbi:aspartate carbamoyltransferase [Methanobacterium alcaliphilum]|uniref:aspartate carbamoyltransferase n=1 Tax=Methanobacterium alcaliphilum TaxID=392018 RepID=UPI002009EF4C|nr:aspartate carbamoyltransferase [Methanobacterium alcaliphilum]MCK9151131.1 aspartate carbamoyltransferase [Methanobacterium alcaliphilum]